MARILIGNIKGPKGDQGPQGIQGPIGPEGPQGPLPPLIANYLASEQGVAALDAIVGKWLDERITANANGLAEVNSKLGVLEFAWEQNPDKPNYTLIKIGNVEVARFIQSFNSDDYVTDSDLFASKIAGTVLADEAAINNVYDNWSSAMNDSTWYRGVISHNVSHSVLGGGTWYLEGYKTDAYYEWQCIRSYSGTGIRMFVRSKYNGTWNSWVAK